MLQPIANIKIVTQGDSTDGKEDTMTMTHERRFIYSRAALVDGVPDGRPHKALLLFSRETGDHHDINIMLL
jgi:hypothetical protein